MQHSLNNKNQVRFHGLDLFDNTVSENELCIKVDDETRNSLQFKGTKCVFEYRVPTLRELGSCPYYDMPHDAEWNPWAIDLRPLHNISKAKK